MITLEVENRYTKIKGTVGPKVLRRLKDTTSFYIKGAHFSKAFQQGFWDGREHLLKFSKKNGGYTFPTGLLKNVIDKLDGLKMKYKIDTSKRRMPNTRDRVFYAWNEKEFEERPHQSRAIRSVMEDGIFQGSGVLVLPVRSGKTIIMARIICDLAVKALIIVPSQNLLYQTQKVVSRALYTDVGLIGDGIWEEKNVTVATIQTLDHARGGKRKKNRKTIKLPTDPRYEKLLTKYDMVFFDEVHHLVADTYHTTMMDFDAPFKIGVSATVEDKNQNEIEKGVIWLKACCGEVRIRVSTSDLIQRGYLMQPTIELYPIREPDLNDRGWSQKLPNKGIYRNKFRNKAIVDITKEKIGRGHNVLIITSRLAQVRILARKFEKEDIAFWTITGSDNKSVRQSRVKDFVDGGVKVLIGTVFGEGVDIPEIECVINAEGGQDSKATMQRLRNLTPKEGKGNVTFVDFIDFTNRYFADHSRKRLQKYRSEPAFIIKYMKDFG